MNPTHLRYFLAVAETGSFTRGAERAFVAQPTLSAAIAKLEQELAVRLLERRGRRTELTEHGQRFLVHAREILWQIEDAKRQLARPAAAEELRLGVIDTVPFPALARLLQQFVQANPGARLRLHEGSAEQMSRWLASGRIEAAITAAQPGATGGRSLFRDRAAVALPTGHALMRKPTIQLADLHDVPLVAWTRLDWLPALRRRLDAGGIRPRLVFRTDHAASALAAVGAGLGLCPLPSSFGAPETLPIIEDYPDQRRIDLQLPPTPTDMAQTFRHFAASHDWRPARADARFDIAH